MPKRSRITLKEIEHLAWLARIQLTRKEKMRFKSQLSTILEYFDKLDEAKVEELPPTFHVVEHYNVFREDEPEQFPSDTVLKNPPKKKGRFIKAPRIV